MTTRNGIQDTYWSTAKASNEMVFEQIGHDQVSPCSCSCRNEVASKHWLCVQTVDRQGSCRRKADKGHLRDMTVDVATRSESCALLITVQWHQNARYPAHVSWLNTYSPGSHSLC